MKAIGLHRRRDHRSDGESGLRGPRGASDTLKPATGDAGIVVYLGLGVMALAGGVAGG